MNNDLNLKDYHYHLPQENIAQRPADRRDLSRLLVLDSRSGAVSHRQFTDILDYIRDEDLLVVNDTRVFAARLFGRKATGGKVEVFLLQYPTAVAGEAGTAESVALLKSSKRPKPGSTINISKSLSITVVEELEEARVRIRLYHDAAKSLAEYLRECGQVPLPPYITRESGTTAEDTERYQTVYADRPGAVAAPTAGLHFTEDMLAILASRGVDIAKVTLHVGYGTFAPVRHEEITRHNIHKEYVSVSADTVRAVRRTRERGGRVWAVGTTSVRALEYAARSGTLEPQDGFCDLYIYPGYAFQVVDNLITNFHLPESSLMFLVSALCGRETLLRCYHEAIEKGYRFYSYGDAMAVICKP